MCFSLLYLVQDSLFSEAVQSPTTGDIGRPEELQDCRTLTNIDGNGRMNNGRINNSEILQLRSDISAISTHPQKYMNLAKVPLPTHLEIDSAEPSPTQVFGPKIEHIENIPGSAVQRLLDPRFVTPPKNLTQTESEEVTEQTLPLDDQFAYKPLKPITNDVASAYIESRKLSLISNSQRSGNSGPTGPSSKGKTEPAGTPKADHFEKQRSVEAFSGGKEVT